MNIPVTDNGQRPAVGAVDHCLYCKAPLGTHKVDCVCLQRTVVLEMTVRYIGTVPRSWEESQILFSRNEGTRCKSNDIDQIAAESAAGACPCMRAEIKLIREATEDDHEELGYNAMREKEQDAKL
jgi:hypothetical protein